MCLPSQEAVTAIFPFAARSPGWSRFVAVAQNLGPKLSGLHIGLGFTSLDIQEVKSIRVYMGS